MSAVQGRSVPSEIVPATKREIDRRMARARSEVAATLASIGAPSRTGSGRPDPRWISPRELAEKMRRFVGRN